MPSVTRRQFFKISAAGLGASSLAVLGFSPSEALAEVRHFKLARTTETRNTCPYCSVGCGIIMYSLGDRAKNAQSEIIHIEGDPDHPVNRGTLCPKGAGLLDFVHSPNRLKYPGVPRARLRQVEAHLLGRGLRQDRAPHEGRSRQELPSRRTPTARRSTAGSAPASSRPRPRATKPATSPTRSSAASGCWHSTIRHASDTARRWQVLPRRSAAVR